MTSLLHRTVLRTNSVPVVSSLYRALYRAAAAAAAHGLAEVEGTETVYLHRGMTAEGWRPGVSDIDLIVVHREFEEAPEEERFLNRLAARRRVLKAVFPMLGDLWIGTGPELDDYLRWGGLRAWDDSPRWRVLAGKTRVLPENAESQEKRRRLDPWVWALVSHMEVSRRLFCPTGLPQKEDADLRKLYLEVVRFSECALRGDGPPIPRSTAARLHPEAFHQAPRALWEKSAVILDESSRAVLAAVKGTGGETGCWAGTPGEASLEDLRRSAGARGAVLDLPYHLFLIMGQGGGPKGLGKAAEALLSRRPAAVPLVIGPETWSLALQSSYLGAPQGPGAPAAGELPEPIPRLPAALRREAAAEAASWMALWWRPLWISREHPAEWKNFHLRTRAETLTAELEGKNPLSPSKKTEMDFSAMWKLQKRLRAAIR